MTDAERAEIVAKILGESSPAVTANTAADAEREGIIARILGTAGTGQAEPEAPAAKPGQSLMMGAAGALSRGATFGFAPKAKALINSYRQDKPYEEMLAAERGKQAEFADAHPIIDTVAEIGGGLAAGLPGAARVMSMTAIPKLLRLSGVGAVAGGLAGAGNTDGSLSDQATGTWQGAGVGAIAAPVFSGVLNTGANILQNKLIQPVLDRISGSGQQKAAARQVMKQFNRDEITIDEAQTKLSDLGVNAAVADAGGRNVRNLAGTIANTPGTGAKIGEDFLEGRAMGQGQRLNTAINEATGTTTGYHAAVDDLITTRQQAAQPAYAKAYAQTPADATRISEFLASPLAQDGMKRGIAIERNLALAEGRPFDPAAYGLDAKGVPIPGQAPNVRLLDATKRGMDDGLEKYRNQVTGKLDLDGEGRSMDQVRRAFVRELDKQIPDYAAARASYAGPSQSLDALHMGRAALRNDPEVTAGIIGKLSPGDKEFFRNGVARALKDVVDKTGDANDSVRKIFGNEAIRGKLRAAFDDNKAFEAFQKTMTQEARFAKTRNDVLKGSQTSSREASREDVGSDPQPVLDLLRGNFMAAGVGGARYGWNKLTGPAAGNSELVGNMMFNPGQNPQSINLLIEAARKAQFNEALRNRISAGVGVTAGIERPGLVRPAAP